VGERFDYDYSEAEVDEIAGRLRELQKEIDRLHVVANNNRSNYAPKLAKALQQQLRLQRDLKLARRGQKELFSGSVDRG
jgi:uncharacterized protein YecE (DUF72 family)